jgi:hypothetical protein
MDFFDMLTLAVNSIFHFPLPTSTYSRVSSLPAATELTVDRKDD